MAENSVENILEELNNIFMKCDVEGSGIVEKNALIDFLISQEPAWQGDKRMKEKFRKLLLCSESTEMITKDQFINLLLDEFKSSSDTKRDEYTEEVCFGESGGKYLSLSRGIGELYEEDKSASSFDGNYSTVHFVSDGQTLTNEDVVDNADSESPCNNRRLVNGLKEKINILQQKNGGLESSNSSLVTNILSLEEIIIKKEKEAAVHLKKLEVSNKLLEDFKQKEEDAKGKLQFFVEENKSVSIMLSQYERENTKLKESILQLEKEINSSANEKVSQDAKIQDLKYRVNLFSELHKKSQEEMDNLKIKETKEKGVLEQIMEENTILQSQLENSTILAQDLKAQLTTAHRELYNLQNAKLKNRLHPKNSPSDISGDDSLIFLDLDHNGTVDSTIPFETSLLAELQEKIPLAQNSCCCECMKKSPFLSTSSVSVGTELCTSDAAVETVEKAFTESSTMTSHEVQEFPDSGKTAEKSYTLCYAKSKRSLTKWFFLAVILILLCFLLGFLSALVTVIKHSPKPMYCLSSVFDFLHIRMKYPDLHIPIY